MVSNWSNSLQELILDNVCLQIGSTRIFVTNEIKNDASFS